MSRKAFTTKWRSVASDEEFAALFANAHIVAATTLLPKEVPPLCADIYWHLSDGRWLAMYVSASMGCPTCGPETEKEYHVYTPTPEVQP